VLDGDIISGPSACFQVKLGFPLLCLSCLNLLTEGAAPAVQWLAVPQPGAAEGRAGQLISTMRGGHVYTPHQSHNNISGGPNSTQPRTQIILQASDVGGSVCSLGLLSRVVAGLAPYLGDPVLLGVRRHPRLSAGLM